MTKLLLKGAICAALLGVSVACTDGYGPFKPTSSDKGTLSLKIGLDKSLANARGSRAEYSDVTAADLSLRLTSSDGTVDESWESLKDFDEEKEFLVGEYTVEVFYGDPESQEGFESPYFYGSQTINIAENETTEVNISASLCNAMLSIDYTDEFKAYMTSWKAEVNGAGGTSTISEADEDRPVYIKEGRVSVSVDFVKPNGKGGKLEVASFQALSRHIYHLTVGMAGPGSGQTAITVDLDESLAEETVVLDISDDVLMAPAPELSSDTFDPTSVLQFIPGFVDNFDAKVNIIARGGLKSILLHTTGTSLIAHDWPEDIDLLDLTADQKQKIESMGLETRGVFNNPDKLAVIDFAGVLDNISYLTVDDLNNLTTFTLTVKDRYGKVSEPMEIVFEAVRAELELLSGTAYVGSEDVTVRFKFNAGNVDGIKFEYFDNVWKVYREVPAEIHPASTTSVDEYRAEMEVYGEEALTVRATAGKTTSNELVIERTPQVILKGEPNAFAKRAYIPISIGDKDDDEALVTSLMKEAKVYLSTDGTTYKAQTTAPVNGHHYLVVTGLSPNKTYHAKIRNGSTDLEKVADFTFTTEDTRNFVHTTKWDCNTTASGSNWERYEFQGWGTNNPMTTSDGADVGYVRSSGTIPTDDADATEGKAVLLRTIGWGSGNSAAGSKGTSGICKYTDPGLLHLGADRTSRPVGYSSSDNKTNNCSTGPVTTDDLDCGMAFESRPSKLTFQYKYSPKNSADKGYAEIWVKDAAGNIIVQGSLTLDAASSYTTKEIPLTYAPDAPAAAKIYVKFLSSYDMEYIKRTDSNFSGPGFGNLGRGMYLGSQLYIDDVNLVY